MLGEQLGYVLAERLNVLASVRAHQESLLDAIFVEELLDLLRLNIPIRAIVLVAYENEDSISGTSFLGVLEYGL